MSWKSLCRSMIALVAFSLAAPLHASCGSSSCPIDLHALQSSEVRSFSLDWSFQYIDQDQPRIGRRKAAVGEIASDHDEVRTINRLTSLQLAWAADRVQLGLAMPYVSRAHEHIDAGTQTRDHWNFSGMGDVMLQGRYAIVPPASPRHSSLWLTAAAKLPTGSSNMASSSGEDAEVTITPGSGSTDGIVGLTFQSGIIRDTAIQGWLGHSTLIPYFVGATLRVNGRGRDQYRRGNELQVNAGSEYPLSQRLFVVGQVNYRASAKDDAGLTDEDPNLTGGEYLFLSPGIRVATSRATSLYAIVQVPLYQHVNGIQLTSRANYIFGVRRSF